MPFGFYVSAQVVTFSFRVSDDSIAFLASWCLLNVYLSLFFRYFSRFLNKTLRVVQRHSLAHSDFVRCTILFVFPAARTSVFFRFRFYEQFCWTYGGESLHACPRSGNESRTGTSTSFGQRFFRFLPVVFSSARKNTAVRAVLVSES